MAAEPAIVLFDGVCNFCNGAVNFIIKQDKKNVFRFTALQSATGQRLLKQYNLSQNNFNSFILIENGKAYQKSEAALRIANQLPYYWKWTQLFRIIPKAIRDNIYDTIAKHRYKWFGKKEVCMTPSPNVKMRFLE